MLHCVAAGLVVHTHPKPKLPEGAFRLSFLWNVQTNVCLHPTFVWRANARLMEQDEHCLVLCTLCKIRQVERTWLVTGNAFGFLEVPCILESAVQKQNSRGRVLLLRHAARYVVSSTLQPGTPHNTLKE